MNLSNAFHKKNMPYSDNKYIGGSIMREWFKEKRKDRDAEVEVEETETDLEEQIAEDFEIEEVETDLEEQTAEEIAIEEENEEEFKSFFNDVLKRLPKKTSGILLNAYDKSRTYAENILAKSKDQYESIFEEFLEGLDEETKRRTYSTIHAASLTAAIIGCSPIPFSDALLLVPVQLTMMARLHKVFDMKFSENLAETLARELIIVGLGRSAVGNLMKFVPALGTVTGAAVNAVVASTITGALGWVTVKMLHDGEDIFDDVMSFKNQFNTLFNALKSSDKAAK